MKRLVLIATTAATLFVSALGHCQTPYKDITEIRMQRTGCMPAACPTDDFILRPDRYFTIAYYIGHIAVQPLGVSRGAVPESSYKALIDFLEAQDFLSQKDTPPLGVGGGDGTIVSIVRDGQLHRVKIRDLSQTPPALWGVMMSIRGLAADIEWIKHDAGVRASITDFLPGTNHTAPAASPPTYYLNAKRPDEQYASQRTTADAKGNFEFILPPGKYTFSIERTDRSGWRYVGETKEIAVPETGFIKIKPEDLKLEEPRA